MIIAVVGPTASGKSDLAIGVAATAAEKIPGCQGAEIISADAMQLYRGMNIGTAKLTVAERQGIVHHQLDVLEVEEEASVAAYQKQVRALIEDIQKRRKLPVLAGGSGLYLRAVLTDLDLPGTDPSIRASLETELADKGPGWMHQKLATLDPEAASNIDVNNTRRVVRALEVIEITGQPFTSQLPEPTPWQPSLSFAIDWDRQILDERINRRTEKMFADGFVKEVEELASRLRKGKTASRATGYAQVLRYLDGEITLPEAIEETALATRQLARKQLKWFRRDKDLHWLETTTETTVLELVDAVWDIAVPEIGQCFQ